VGIHKSARCNFGTTRCHACSATTVLPPPLTGNRCRCRCRACMLYSLYAGEWSSAVVRPPPCKKRKTASQNGRSSGSRRHHGRRRACMSGRVQSSRHAMPCHCPSSDGVPPHRSTTHPRHQYVRRRSRSRLITLMVVTAIMQHCMPTCGTHLLAISLLRMNVALWDVSGTSTHVLLLKRGFV
jgi:hypothetical protein